MDIWNWMLMTASAVFGAGSVWATLQSRVKENTEDIVKLDIKVEELRDDVDKKYDRIDTKLDRIYEYMLNNKKGHGY